MKANLIELGGGAEWGMLDPYNRSLNQRINSLGYCLSFCLYFLALEDMQYFRKNKKHNSLPLLVLGQICTLNIHKKTDNYLLALILFFESHIQGK